MLELARESLYEVVGEVDPLLRMHYEELARNREVVKLNPDWSRYAAVEAMGSLRIYTARKDTRLVGYSAFFCVPHMHYADMTIANNDVLFLDPAHRTGTTGMRLIEACEAELQREFGDRQLCISWGAKPNTPLGDILLRRGYAVQDVIYTRLAPQGEH